MKILLLAALVAMLSTVAQAASPPPPSLPSLPPLPEPTSAFVAYCQTNAKLCQKQITLSSMKAMLAEQTPSFCIPDSAMSPDAAFNKQIAQIEKWLGKHTELAMQETSMSITAAYRSLYPCK
jgi:predicted transglutaminase-like cysteine proteinase